MRAFALRRKNTFFNRENLDFPLNADMLQSVPDPVYSKCPNNHQVQIKGFNKHPKEWNSQEIFVDCIQGVAQHRRVSSSERVSYIKLTGIHPNKFEYQNIHSEIQKHTHTKIKIRTQNTH